MTDSERAAEIAALRGSGLSYSDAVVGLSQLIDPSFEGYVRPRPPEPPTRLQILEAEAAVEKAAKLKKWNAYIRDLNERLKEPVELHPSPTASAVFKSLEERAEYDPCGAFWLAEAMHDDEDKNLLPDVAHELFLSTLPPLDPSALRIARIIDGEAAMDEADRLHDAGELSDEQHAQCFDLIYTKPTP